MTLLISQRKEIFFIYVEDMDTAQAMLTLEAFCKINIVNADKAFAEVGELKDRMDALNKEIVNPQIGLSTGYQIGSAYFWTALFLHYMLIKVFCPNIFDLKHDMSKDAAFDFLLYLFPHHFNEAMSQGVFSSLRLFEVSHLRHFSAIS